MNVNTYISRWQRTSAAPRFSLIACAVHACERKYEQMEKQKKYSISIFHIAERVYIALSCPKFMCKVKPLQMRIVGMQ